MVAHWCTWHDIVFTWKHTNSRAKKWRQTRRWLCLMYISDLLMHMTWLDVRETTHWKRAISNPKNGVSMSYFTYVNKSRCWRSRSRLIYAGEITHSWLICVREITHSWLINTREIIHCAILNAKKGCREYPPKDEKIALWLATHTIKKQICGT